MPAIIRSKPWTIALTLVSVWFNLCDSIRVHAQEPVGESGKVSWELWVGLPDPAMEDFEWNPIISGLPDIESTLSRLRTPREFGGNYAQRLRGYIVAPVTGEYRFWMTGDDVTEFWLSHSEDKFAREKLISLPGPTYYEWGRESRQASAPVQLVQGQRYFLEARHKETRNDDYMNIAWSYAGGVGLTNWALDAAAVATQSTTTSPAVANRAIDGDITPYWASGSIAATKNLPGSWWKVELGQDRLIDRIELFGRDEDGNTKNITRFSNFRVSVLDSSGATVASKDFHTGGSFGWAREFWETGGVMGCAVKVESLGVNAAGDHFLVLTEVQVWGRPDPTSEFQGLEIVPGSDLESYAGSLNDVDNDDLPDDWELQYGFDPSMVDSGEMAPYADTDRDGLSNLMEAFERRNPLVSDSIPDALTLEYWDDSPFYSVSELVMANHFYEEQRMHLLESAQYRGFSQFSAARIRGYIIPPTTGTYHFWISSRNASEFWLSEDETPARKRRIAEMGAEFGTAEGIYVLDPNRYDQFVCQMSEPIELVAGQPYFFEVLSQQGHAGARHVSMAWAPPGQERESLPMSVVSSFGVPSDDRDDDTLPDAWESQFGLDPLDNGLTDRAKQGDRGDFDEDGLSNRREYLFGTDPTNPDTDGDGLSDLAEIETYGTNPAVSDVTPENVVATVSPASVIGLGESWVQTGGGALSSSFRGMGKWNFSVPSDGIWIVQLEGRLRGDLRLEDVVPVQASVNGGQIERTTMSFRGDQSASLRVITPWLSAGTHQFGLYIDNYTARRSLEVTAIQIVEPGGLDTDGNGYSDVVERYLRSRNQVLPYNTVVTPVSPVFVEGLGRSLDHFELRTEHDGPGSTIRHKDSYWANKIPQIQSSRSSLMNTLLANPGGDRSPAGALHPSLNGPGYGKWFAEIPLNANQATGYSAFFENGALGASGVFVWRPINLFDTTQITIPAGRNLLMGAWDNESDNSDLTFTIDGQLQPTFKANDALAWPFPNVGSYAISVLHHASGQTLGLTVNVRGADLQPDIALGELRYLDVDLPGVTSDLVIDSGGEIGLDQLHALASGGSRTTMRGLFPGIHRTAARLSETEAILDQEVVHVVGVSDALRNASDIAAPYGDGIFLVRSPLLVSHLPTDGAYVEISIFAGGVTFSDGTTFKRIDHDDLDENGVIVQEFLMPAERLGAPCHYVEVYDKTGTRIWSCID